MQNRIDIWEIDLSADPTILSRYKHHLAQEEQERIDSCTMAKGRAQYGITRIALRDVLSRYIGKTPANIEIMLNPCGKPYLLDHPVFFNLSHAEDKAVIAVCRTMDLGVDLEKIRQQEDALSIAAKFFSEKENDAVKRAKGPEEEIKIFHAIWTRKEAFAKALGKGLAYPFTAFSVCPEFAMHESQIEVDGEEPGNWKNISFLLGEYAGAVAVKNRPVHLEFFKWAPQEG